MRQKLRVSFESPQSGWMSLGLHAGTEGVAFAASCGHYNSLLELIDGLRRLLDGQGFVTRWACEPDEYDFHFTTDGQGGARLDVTHHPGHRRLDATGRMVFSVQDSSLNLTISFWRALRDLLRRSATDEFERNWRRAFPFGALRELTRQLRAVRRELRAHSAKTTP